MASGSPSPTLRGLRPPASPLPPWRLPATPPDPEAHASGESPAWPLGTQAPLADSDLGSFGPSAPLMHLALDDLEARFAAATRWLTGPAFPAWGSDSEAHTSDDSTPPRLERAAADTPYDIVDVLDDDEARPPTPTLRGDPEVHPSAECPAPSPRRPSAAPTPPGLDHAAAEDPFDIVDNLEDVEARPPPPSLRGDPEVHPSAVFPALPPHPRRPTPWRTGGTARPPWAPAARPRLGRARPRSPGQVGPWRIEGSADWTWSNADLRPNGSLRLFDDGTLLHNLGRSGRGTWRRPPPPGLGRWAFLLGLPALPQALEILEIEFGGWTHLAILHADVTGRAYGDIPARRRSGRFELRRSAIWPAEPAPSDPSAPPVNRPRRSRSRTPPWTRAFREGRGL